MKRLLYLEYLKFRYYRAFRVVGILYLLLLPGLLLMTNNIEGIPPELGAIDQYFIFPNIWSSLAYLGNWLSFFFLGIIGVLSISIEFENRTFRQNIITGLSRGQFFSAKFLLVLAVATLATLYFCIVALLAGSISTETIYLSKVLEGLPIIGQFWLMCVGYTSLGLLMATLFKRTGLALFSYLAYSLFLESIIRWAIHFNFFPNTSMHYYPLNALEDLAPIPIPQLAKELMRSNEVELFLSPEHAIITASIYLFLFWIWIYWRIKRADL